MHDWCSLYPALPPITNKNISLILRAKGSVEGEAATFQSLKQ